MRGNVQIDPKRHKKYQTSCGIRVLGNLAAPSPLVYWTFHWRQLTGGVGTPQSIHPSWLARLATSSSLVLLPFCRAPRRVISVLAFVGPG